MVSKFKCAACGKCCARIGGFVSDSERKFVEEYGYGKMPLVQMHPVDEMTFPLWDFEAKRFRKYAADIKLGAKIEPSRGVFDLDSGKFIVFTYHMNSFSCPFLGTDFRCRVYDKKRAFICYSFPFNKSPFLGDDKVIFGECTELRGIVNELDYNDKSQLVKQLSDSFDDAFLAAVQHDFMIEWSNKLLLEMIKLKKIRPAINYPYDKLMKRISNSLHIDLFDFLVESGYKTREEVDNLVRRFEKYEDAKDKISFFSS